MVEMNPGLLHARLVLYLSLSYIPSQSHFLCESQTILELVFQLIVMLSASDMQNTFEP